LPASGFKSYHFDDSQIVERPKPDMAHFQAAGNADMERFSQTLKAKVKFLVLGDKSDTWGHGMSRYDSVEGEFKMESVSAMTGPVTDKLYQKFTYGKSSLDMVCSAYKGLPGVYAEIKVKWAEHRKILKMEIAPQGADSPFIMMQCAGGSVRREADGKELPMHHWIWQPVGGSGFAVMQKGAFACDCLNGRLRLTLVRSSIYGFHDPAKLNPADPQLDTDVGRHGFNLILSPCQNRDDDYLIRASAILNEPLTVIRES